MKTNFELYKESLSAKALGLLYFYGPCEACPARKDFCGKHAYEEKSVVGCARTMMLWGCKQNLEESEGVGV